MLVLTEGERGILLAYIGLSVFGSGLAFTVVNALGGSDEILRTLYWHDVWIIISGGIGAAAALFLSRNRLGHPGWEGWRQAAGAALIITLTATVIAGTLALPGYGTMFGPFATVLTFWQTPMIPLFWVIMLIAAHLLHAAYRRERDTLFDLRDDRWPA